MSKRQLWSEQSSQGNLFSIKPSRPEIVNHYFVQIPITYAPESMSSWHYQVCMLESTWKSCRNLASASPLLLLITITTASKLCDSGWVRWGFWGLFFCHITLSLQENTEQVCADQVHLMTPSSLRSADSNHCCQLTQIDLYHNETAL